MKKDNKIKELFKNKEFVFGAVVCVALIVIAILEFAF